MKHQKPLTLQQIEHWLIYHVPLQLADHWNWDVNPFKVEVETDHPGAVGCICYHNTPWDAYRNLAKLVLGHEPTLEYVTRKYNNS